MLRGFKLLVDREFSISRRFFSNEVTDHQFLNRVRTPIEAGQAIHESRPNLLEPGEVTPGITAKEYYARRIELAKKLPAKSCAIIAGSKVKYASGAVFYPFHQNSNLFYLSGWNEPDSVIVLEKPTENLDDVVFHMIVPPKDSFVEQWEGTRTGANGAKDIFNADEVADSSVLALYISKVIKRNECIYFDIPKDKAGSNNTSFFNSFFTLPNPSNGQQTIYEVLKSSGPNKKVRDVNKIVAELRKIKSAAELRIMRRAGQISGRAYNQAFAKRFRNERTLASFLEYKFISGGCDKSAYVPVVATGSNALCIHYTRNDDIMYDDEMVLVDAAGSLGGYCSDISRTWPVNGKFTGPQRDLYEVVLNVQKKCMKLFTASQGFSIHDIHEKSVEFMKMELRNAGFHDIQKWDVNKLYPHYIGHHLGLDVHDVPEVPRTRPIEEGQVITVEPGLYVPDDSRYPSHFRKIGIRIEDDIAVGRDTYTNLTVEAVKELADLEHIMQHGIMQDVKEDVTSPLH